MLELADMGYRSAIEFLIKDDVLHFKLDTHENIAKQKLANAIPKYLDDQMAIKGADVVRILDNDFTHWDKVHDLPVSTVKYYLVYHYLSYQHKVLP
jgi:hypothetical protein